MNQWDHRIPSALALVALIAAPCEAGTPTYELTILEVASVCT